MVIPREIRDDLPLTKQNIGWAYVSETAIPTTLRVIVQSSIPLSFSELVLMVRILGSWTLVPQII